MDLNDEETHEKWKKIMHEILKKIRRTGVHGPFPADHYFVDAKDEWFVPGPNHAGWDEKAKSKSS